MHIGDNFTTDFCGARAAGMQALYLGRYYWWSTHTQCILHDIIMLFLRISTFLDRSANERIGTYQEWLKAPDYEGKSQADIKAHTITSLRTVKEHLIAVNKV